MSKRSIVLKLILSILIVSNSMATLSQNNSSEKNYHFNGSVTISSNGISIIPSFSLDKPALIVDLSMGSKKLSFDPQFRFALEGRPWSFIFWGRYKPFNNEKFSMHIGAHPAIMFHEVTFENNGVSEEGLEARRFVAAEIAPTMNLTKHFSWKPYYLIGHGFDRGLKNTHYLTMRGSISNIAISKKLLFSFTPEVYFLKMDKKHGFYFASAFSLKHKTFPLSLNAMVNKKLESDIRSKDFIWNISLVYSFGNHYKKG